MRLIDADKFEVYSFTLTSLDFEAGVLSVLEKLDAAPTVDAVEVVRCKDCEYAERYERMDGTAGYYCGHPQNIFTYGEHRVHVLKPIKETYDFCSYGVRKDGGADDADNRNAVQTM